MGYAYNPILQRLRQQELGASFKPAWAIYQDPASNKTKQNTTTNLALQNQKNPQQNHQKTFTLRTEASSMWENVNLAAEMEQRETEGVSHRLDYWQGEFFEVLPDRFQSTGTES